MSKQLKKLKARMSKGQLQHRENRLYNRRHHFNIVQEKDRPLNLRVKFENIG